VVYTDTGTVMPLKAEGLSGCLQPKPPLHPEEHTSPRRLQTRLILDADEQMPHGPSLLRSRRMRAGARLWSLCADQSVLSEREIRSALAVRGELPSDAPGTRAVTVDNLDVCAAPIDHCDGHLPSNLSMFWNHPARVWLRDWFDTAGPFD
jgi:AP endonuclease 2